MAAQSVGHEEKPDDGLRVTHLPRPNHRKRVHERNLHYFQKLVVLERRLSRGKVRREEEVDFLVREPRRRIHRYDRLPLRCFVSGFFLQLPPRTVDWRFARLEATGRDFQEKPVGRVAVLLDQQDVRAEAQLGQRDNRGSPRMSNDLDVSNRSVGKAERVNVE